ncbi:hypothetical protein BUY19_12525 [Staphylococcus cohnii]|nr:hypothetical protein BUY19_12525 [Staphylococcus cohnii]
MFLLETNEKLVLLLIIFGSLILNFIYFLFTINNQKKINYLHPGWLIIAVLFLYGQVTPIYVLFVQVEDINNHLFIRLFNFDYFIEIYLMYVLTTLLFFIVDLIFYSSINNKNKIIEFSNFEKSKERSVFLTGVLLYVIGIIIFIYNFKTINSLDTQYIYDKTSRLNGDEINLGISHTSFYMVSFFFLFNSFYITNKKAIKTAIILMFITFSFFIFYLGTTLQVFLMVIAFFYITFKYSANKFKKLLIYSVIIIPVFYFCVQLSEAYRLYKLKLTNKIDLVNLFDFSTFESITGYISGLIFLNTTNLKEKYNFTDLILGFLPGSVENKIGDQRITITEIINQSPFLTSNGLYVPTLPISMLFNVVLSIIILIIVYFSISYILYFLNRGSISKFLVSILIYIEIFYLLRINMEAWLGKLRLDLVILLVGIILYKFLNSYFYKINKKGE